MKVRKNFISYYIDFDYFELNDKSITGDFYLKWKMGPVPASIDLVLKDMDYIDITKQKKRPYHKNDTVVYQLNKKLTDKDIEILSNKEKK